MRWMTEDADVRCTHVLGSVERRPSQTLLTVDGRRVLVQPDPVGRSVRLCPNYGITVKPCTSTIGVSTGYAAAIRVDGQPVALDTLRGPTDGVPPSIVEFQVFDAGQSLVRSDR